MNRVNIIRRSSFASTALKDAISYSDDSALFVLIDDGVYSVLDSALQTDQINNQFYAVNEHLNARGIIAPNFINVITMKEFVEITLNNQPIVTWQ